MPIYIQRQFSQCLEFVLPDRASKWRLRWFEEIKVPLLTSLLFIDEKGKANLQERVKSLNKLILEHVVPSLPDECEAMTEEEAFIFIALKNKMLHMRGKLLVMNLMGQIKDGKKKKDDDLPNPHTNSAESVFHYLLGELSKYDPTFNARVSYMEDENTVAATMQEALDADQGSEAVMDRAINSAISKAAVALDEQMQKIKKDLISDIKAGQVLSHKELENEVAKTQTYINAVHTF